MDVVLKDQLVEWTDWDVAAFLLAQSLGLIGQNVSFATEVKHVFWTDNAIGSMLHKMLRDLVAEGILEYRDEPDDQFRWNQSFVGSWEQVRRKVSG